MKINEGTFGEIDTLIDEYMDFCKKHGREPSLRRCFMFIADEFGTDENDTDLFKYVKQAYEAKEEPEPDLEEAKKVCESFGYRVLKEADELDTRPEEGESEEDEEEDDEDEKAEKEFLAEFDDNIASLIKQLAEETGNEVTDAKVTEETGSTGHAVLVEFGNEEYECYDDYDDAEEAAKEDIKNLIDDCGGVMHVGFQWGNLGGREQYISESDAASVVREDFEQMLSDMSDEEKQEQYEETDDETIIEHEMDYINSYVDYIVDNWGEDQLDNLIKRGIIDFDIDQLAQDCVDADGVAHNLASYDGDEIELDGWWAYRRN